MFQRVKIKDYIFLFYIDKENDHADTDVIGVYSAKENIYDYLEIPYTKDSFRYTNDEGIVGLLLETISTPNGIPIKIVYFYNTNLDMGTEQYNTVKPLCIIYQDNMTKNPIVELTKDMYMLEKTYTKRKELEGFFMKDKKCQNCLYLQPCNYTGVWSCRMQKDSESATGIECNCFTDLDKEIEISQNAKSDFEMRMKRLQYNLSMEYIKGEVTIAK